MIFGDCPYCGAPMMNDLAEGEKLPVWERIAEADCCGEVVWLKHSRVDPVAMTDSDFKAKHNVSPDKVISEKVA